MAPAATNRRPRTAPGRGRRVLRRLAWLGLPAALAAGGWFWLQGFVGPVTTRPHCTAFAEGDAAELDPEQAGNAAVISAVAVRRGLPARAASIGVATAIQESKLRNIDYGDRDSLGLFQQRPSQGWGTPAQVQDPVYAANAFYDVLVKIEGFQNLEITDAAQRVQRSAFPTAYADHEPEARIIASALTGYSPASLTCVLRPPDATLARQRPGDDGLTPRGAAVVAAARQEAGRSPAGPAAEDGTAVRFALRGEDRHRLGWSLAQWAVARADGLHVVEVETDGQRWRRTDPGDGWTRLRDADRVPPGTVVVRVARGG